MHCRIFRSISGVYPLNASSIYYLKMYLGFLIREGEDMKTVPLKDESVTDSPQRRGRVHHTGPAVRGSTRVTQEAEG